MNQNISQTQYDQIRSKIKRKFKFFSFLGTYLVVCTFLTFLDYFDKSSKGQYSVDWVYWVWLGWGIGLAFAFLNTFVYPKIEENMIQAEMDKLSKE